MPSEAGGGHALDTVEEIVGAITPFFGGLPANCCLVLV
jgi:hypothetical protein